MGVPLTGRSRDEPGEAPPRPGFYLGWPERFRVARVMTCE